MFACHVYLQEHASQDLVDDWTSQHRSQGNIISQNLDDMDTNNLLELAMQAVRMGESQDDMLLDGDKVSQQEARVLLQQAREQDIRNAENECNDILEASQMIDNRERREEYIPQVDGSGDSPSHSTGEADPSVSDLTLPSEDYVSRSKVRRSSIRLSQVRRLFYGNDVPPDETEGLVQVPKAAGSPVHSEEGILQPAKSLPLSSTVGRPKEHLAMWKEIASQTLYENLDWDVSQSLSNEKDPSQEDCADSQMHQNRNNEILLFKPSISPPLAKDLSWREHGLLPIIHPAPHFSNSEDIVKDYQVFAGKAFKMKSMVTCDLPSFQVGSSKYSRYTSEFKVGSGNADLKKLYKAALRPPSYVDVFRWTLEEANLLKHEAMGSVKKEEIKSLMDPNTGKMLPEAFCEPENSDHSLLGSPHISSFRARCLHTEVSKSLCTQTPDIAEIDGTRDNNDKGSPMVPASPKYDESGGFFKQSTEFVSVTRHKMNASSNRLTGNQKHRSKTCTTNRISVSQITPPSAHGAIRTPESQLGFKMIEPGKGEGLTVACIEIHAACRGKLLPDPNYDAVHAIIISIFDDHEVVSSGQYYSRVMLWDEDCQSKDHCLNLNGMTDIQFSKYQNEEQLINSFAEAIRFLDPDVLVGFEIQNNSLGYLAERAACKYDNQHFLSDLSTTPATKEDLDFNKDKDQYGWQHSSGIHVNGRIVLNLWRIIQGGMHFCVFYLAL